MQTRTITREEAMTLGHQAWFIWVGSRMVWQTNVKAR
jgi:hypothetical protein